MKTTKNSFKSPAQAIAASKLVVASSALHADFTDGSKANQLSISQGETVYWVVNPDGSGNGNQIATPLLEIIQDDSNKIMPKGEDSRGQSKSETVIYPGAVNLDLFNGTAGEYIEEKFFVHHLVHHRAHSTGLPRHRDDGRGRVHGHHDRPHAHAHRAVGARDQAHQAAQQPSQRRVAIR